MKVARGGVLTGFGLIAALGCGSSESTPKDGVVVVLPDGGTAVVSPPPPPPAKGGEPPDGVFVSASKGIEGADGAKTRPLKSIAAALPLAASRRVPVIVCSETYTEAVTLLDGVTMYGYFDCSNIEKWVRSDAHATISPPTSPAVLAADLTLLMNFEGFDVVGPDMAGTAAPGTPAASSYGMVVRNTKNLVVVESSIRGGKGQDGSDGAEPGQPNAELGAATAGADAPFQQQCAVSRLNPCDDSYVAGATAGVSSCRVGPNGGAGGVGGMGVVSANGVARQPAFVTFNANGLPIAASASTNKGGVVGTVGLNPGANGAKGGVGPNGNNGTWTFTKDGFVPGDGTLGQNGLPGQGGGGGAGATSTWSDRTHAAGFASGVYYGAAGAGGGAGGCAGLAGTAGTGGGASIGLFIMNSVVSLKNAKLAGTKGGRAGKGSLGTVGTPGALGGRGIWEMEVGRPDRLYGAAGGDGGEGGPAGFGGSGAPGPSIALVHTGGAPTTSEVELTKGVAGDGAPALTRGTQSQPATTGLEKTEHSF